MITIPAALLADLSPEEQRHAKTWWASLSVEVQLEIVRTCDDRADDGAWFGVVRDGRLEWHPLPVELVGRFVDPADAAEHDLFKQQLLEFVSNHEEIQFFLVERTFHICRAHPAARAAICSGCLPADFTCPNADAECPMRRLLAQAPGKDVIFDVRARLPVRVG